MKVKIPFKPYFEESMLNGAKRATSRTKKFGNVGDTFGAFGVLFELTGISQSTLLNVAENYWREEGCGSQSNFESIWKSIYPNKGFVPDQAVWVHWFKSKEGK